MMPVQKVLNIYKTSMELNDKSGSSKSGDYTKNYNTHTKKTSENNQKSFHTILKNSLNKN